MFQIYLTKTKKAEENSSAFLFYKNVLNYFNSTEL